jgi:hypothetical protein
MKPSKSKKAKVRAVEEHLSKKREQRKQKQTQKKNNTALRSTPELASPSVKISFLIKGFRLLFPIRDPVEFS